MLHLDCLAPVQIVGFIVGCVVFVLLEGALLFVLAALWYEKRGAHAQK